MEILGNGKKILGISSNYHYYSITNFCGGPWEITRNLECISDGFLCDFCVISASFLWFFLKDKLIKLMKAEKQWHSMIPSNMLDNPNVQHYNSILLWASPVQLTHQTATFYLDNQGGRRLFIQGRGRSSREEAFVERGGIHRGHASREGGGRSLTEEAVLQQRKEVVHWGREETVYWGREERIHRKGGDPEASSSREEAVCQGCQGEKLCIEKGGQRLFIEKGMKPCVEGGRRLTMCWGRRPTMCWEEETIRQEGGDSPSRDGDQFIEGGQVGGSSKRGLWLQARCGGKEEQWISMLGNSRIQHDHMMSEFQWT